MIAKIIVPDIGENVVSGKVVAVHIQAGDSVDLDDTVIELETDKAVVEIPSTAKGKVTEVLAAEGDELKVGDLIARVETEDRSGDESRPGPSSEEAADNAAAGKTGGKAEDEQAIESDATTKSADSQPHKNADAAAGKDEPAEKQIGPQAHAAAVRPVPASPAIRRMARELGVHYYGAGHHATEPPFDGWRGNWWSESIRSQAAAPAAGLPNRTSRPMFSESGSKHSSALSQSRRPAANRLCPI